MSVEFDEASWLAAEFGQGAGGTVNSCELATSSCDVLAQLPLPTGVASTRRHVYATMLALVPGEADVVKMVAPSDLERVSRGILAGWPGRSA